MLLTLGTSALLAADPDFDPEAVSLRGFRLLPLASLETANRALEWHPKGLVGLGWDSLPAPGSDSKSAIFTQGLLGLEARLQGTGGWRGDLDAEFHAERYLDTPGRDLNGGVGNFSLLRERDGSSLLAHGSFERAHEPVSDLPDSVLRDSADADISAGSEGRTARWSVHATWDMINYLQDSAYFDSDERDLRRFGGAADWNLTGGDDSLIGLEASAQQVQRSANASVTDNHQETVVARWRHAFTSRSSTDLRLGATSRSYKEDTAGDPDNHDRKLLVPAASLRLGLGWDDRSLMSLTASTGLTESVIGSANAARRFGLEGRLRQRILDRLDAVASTWVTRRVDTGAAPGLPREQAIDCYARAELDYRLREGLGLRVWASCQQIRAEVSDSYYRWQTALELCFAL